MESLQLGDTGDLVMADGDLQIVSEMDEVIQTYQTLMRTNLNEWFLNADMGFDFSVIYGVKRINYDKLRLALQRVADQMDEIDYVEGLKVEECKKTRRAKIKAKAVTVDGLSFDFEEVF